MLMLLKVSLVFMMFGVWMTTAEPPPITLDSSGSEYAKATLQSYHHVVDHAAKPHYAEETNLVHIIAFLAVPLILIPVIAMACMWLVKPKDPWGHPGYGYGGHGGHGGLGIEVGIPGVASAIFRSAKDDLRTNARKMNSETTGRILKNL